MSAVADIIKDGRLFLGFEQDSLGERRIYKTEITVTDRNTKVALLKKVLEEEVSISKDIEFAENRLIVYSTKEKTSKLLKLLYWGVNNGRFIDKVELFMNTLNTEIGIDLTGVKFRDLTGGIDLSNLRIVEFKDCREINEVKLNNYCNITIINK